MAKNDKKKTGLAAALEKLERQVASLARWRPPAEASAIEAVERALGAPLPDDVRTWFAWHDGQVEPRQLRAELAWTPLSVQQAQSAWQELEQAKGEPWSASWLPLFENGGGDYVVYELAPGRNQGMLFEYWHIDRSRPLHAKSLEAWAKQLEKDLRARAARRAQKGAVILGAAGRTWTAVDIDEVRRDLSGKPAGTAYAWRVASPGKLHAVAVKIGPSQWLSYCAVNSRDNALQGLRVRVEADDIRALADSALFEAGFEYPELSESTIDVEVT